MKKILLITRPISPPWDEASKNFAYDLAINSDDSEFFLMGNRNVPLEKIPANVKVLPVYSSNDFGLMQKARLFFFLWKNSNGFDIAHLIFTPTKLNTFLLKLVLGKKIRTMQTIATLREDLFPIEELKKLMFADKVITYSDYAKNRLLSYGLSSVSQIYPGINLENYRSAPKNKAFMSEFGLSENDFTITYPGEYVRLGATDMLVEILPELFSKIPNAKFIFANRIKNSADAAKKSSVVEKIEKLGLLEKVIFTDTFSDMPAVYNSSDVVVFPVGNMRGKFDVPLAVIEAFACAKPVIISDIPVLREFSDNNISVMIKTGDKQALIEAIVRLNQDPVFAKEVAAKAQEFVSTTFDIKNAAKKYQAAYAELLS